MKKKMLFLFFLFLILLLPVPETCGAHKYCAMPPQRPGQTVCYPAEYKPLGVILAENLLNKTIAIRYKEGISCR